MNAQIVYKAEYKYGNLIYSVTIVKKQSDVNWETDQEIAGDRYFVEYVEETLPSRNSVGGFESLEGALEWAKSRFGQLQWSDLTQH